MVVPFHRVRSHLDLQFCLSDGLVLPCLCLSLRVCVCVCVHRYDCGHGAPRSRVGIVAVTFDRVAIAERRCTVLGED